MPYPRRSLHERLHRKIDSSGGPDACHPWTGYVNNNGYAKTTLDGRKQLVHRLIYIEVHGPILPSTCICRKCDNRICCNVTHLFAGTHADNVADKVCKGRHLRGAKHPLAVLNNSAVTQIRRAYAKEDGPSLTKLAEK